MKVTNLTSVCHVAALLGRTTAQANVSTASVSTSSNGSISAPSCPSIWTTVAADLRHDFSNCSQKATNAIRFALHDASGYSGETTPYGPASGGADGSLLLNTTEVKREEHNPMQGFQRYLSGIYQTYAAQGVGAADLVQFAASLGVTSCSGGPVYKTVIGRRDDATAAPAGLVPAAFGPDAEHDVLIQLFADKGFDEREVAALMGAHSVSRAFVQSSHGIPANAPQDSTPQIWDMLYCSETLDPPAGVYPFDSDVHLANASTCSGQAFAEFASDRDAWVTAFTAAMYKLSILGIPENQTASFVDCTAVIQLNATA